MTLVSAAGVGGLAGLVGAALAHVLGTLAGRAGSDAWLRGLYGPPFFNAALYTGLFYGAIGAAAGRRARTAAVGFLGAFLGMAVPLYVLTRYGGLTPPEWIRVLVAVYVAAVWGTIAAIGASASRTRPWRGAAAAILGSLAGYAALTGFTALLPALVAPPQGAAGLRPPLVNLMDGLLSGAGLCLALTLDERLSRRPS